MAAQTQHQVSEQHDVAQVLFQVETSTKDDAMFLYIQRLGNINQIMAASDLRLKSLHYSVSGDGNASKSI